MSYNPPGRFYLTKAKNDLLLKEYKKANKINPEEILIKYIDKMEKRLYRIGIEKQKLMDEKFIDVWNNFKSNQNFPNFSNDKVKIGRPLKVNVELLKSLLSTKKIPLGNLKEILKEYNKVALLKISSPETIRRTMKKILKYRKKLVVYKAKNILLPRVKLIKYLVICQIAKFIAEDSLFISVDESGYGAFPKRSKIWAKSNANTFLYNYKRFKNHSLVMGVSNTGIKYLQVHEGSIKGTKFAEFIKNMNLEFRKEGYLSKNKRIIVILDNCPTHLVEEVTNQAKASKIYLLYNAPYCPQFNFIELVFSQIRCKMDKKSHEKK